MIRFSVKKGLELWACVTFLLKSSYAVNSISINTFIPQLWWILNVDFVFCFLYEQLRHLAYINEHVLIYYHLICILSNHFVGTTYHTNLLRHFKQNRSKSSVDRVGRHLFKDLRLVCSCNLEKKEKKWEPGSRYSLVGQFNRKTPGHLFIHAIIKLYQPIMCQQNTAQYCEDTGHKLQLMFTSDYGMDVGGVNLFD